MSWCQARSRVRSGRARCAGARRALPPLAARAAAGRPPRRPLGGRGRPRTGDAPRCVPARAVPDAHRVTARLVLPGMRRRPLEPFPPSARCDAPPAGSRSASTRPFAKWWTAAPGPGSVRAGSTPGSPTRTRGSTSSAGHTPSRRGTTEGSRGASTASGSAASSPPESMFHARTGASKAAFVALVELLRSAGDAERPARRPVADAVSRIARSGGAHQDRVSASPCRRTRAHRSVALMDPSRGATGPALPAGTPAARGLMRRPEEGLGGGTMGSPTPRRAGRCRSRGRSRRGAGRARSR